jgi:hypothetical protein
VDKKFSILIATGAQTGMEEDQPVRVQILGNNGQGVPGAEVFTNDTRVYTDANGYATIPAPYDGVIYASADCYPTTGLMFTIVKKGAFAIPQQVLVGVDTSIRILDSHGLPIAGAVVQVDGTTLTTDSNGMVHYTFNSPGIKSISAQDAGYDIPGMTVNVTQEASCGYPNAISLMFNSANIWQLWLISVLFAIANFFLIRYMTRRITRGLPVSGTLLQLAYAGVPPLIAAIPGTGLGICLMSNIVVVQLMAGLAVVAWQRLRQQGADKGKPEQKKRR